MSASYPRGRVLEPEGVDRFRARVDDDALRLEVELERLESELASEARLLVAPEWDPRKGRVRHVDAHRARLDPCGDPMAACGIAGPNGRHQPVLHVVREADRVLLVLEGDDRHDRAEDLLLRDRHLVVDLREDCRRIERARTVDGLTAGDDLGAVSDTLLDIAVHLAAVLLR